MFDPSMFGINKQQMEQVQQVSRRVRVQLRVNPKGGKLELTYIADENDPEAGEMVYNMVTQMADQMSGQLYSMFAIQGEWIDVD